MRLGVLFTIVVSLWLSQPPTKTPLFKSTDLTDWLGAAAEHEPGVEDAPLRRIAGWSGDKLLRTLDTAREELPSEELNALLERAAVLHGDIMLLRRDVDERWTDIGEVRGSSIMVHDGRRIGSRPLEPHVQFARRIFRAMREPALQAPSRPDAASGEQPTLTWHAAHRRNPRIHQWYRTISTELAARHWLSDLRPHLEDARRVLSDSAATMFDTACLSEATASAQVQRAVTRAPSSQMNTMQLRVESDAMMLDERYNLSEAERYYREAMKLDPGYREARVRLARVLSLRERHGDALALLQAGEETTDPVVRYYGALALGRAAEGTQNAALAREAYQRATALFPRAQSPLLALMRLARERADDATAKEVAATFALLGPVENYRVDPWWDYFDCNGRNRQRELDQLWSLYRRPALNPNSEQLSPAGAREIDTLWAFFREAGR